MIARHGLAVVLILVTGAFALAAGGWIDGPAMRGAILGAVLAAIGSIGGTILLVRSSGRGARRFIGGLAVGILARSTLFLAALVYLGLRRPAGLPLAAVALSLLAFFFVFQALEVRLVLKRSAGGAA